MSILKPSKSQAELQHFDLTGLQFQSFGSSERLRVSVRRHSSSEAPAFAIWVERKSSKEQWELDVDDVAQHCDIAVPAKVVLSRLKVSSARVCCCARRRCLNALAAESAVGSHGPRGGGGRCGRRRPGCS